MEPAELKKRRKAAGLTQADLADRVGLSRDYIGLMERGLVQIAPRTADAIRSLKPKAPARRPTSNDPMEYEIERALIEAGLDFRADHGGANDVGLDFYLTQFDVYIEVKQFHTPRIADQMARAPNVIAVQGRHAIRFMANAIRSGDFMYALLD